VEKCDEPGGRHRRVAPERGSNLLSLDTPGSRPGLTQMSPLGGFPETPTSAEDRRGHQAMCVAAAVRGILSNGATLGNASVFLLPGDRKQ